MEFIIDGRKFMLRGATTVPTKLVSTNQIQKDLRCMSQASIVQILSMQGDEEDIVEEEQQGSCSMTRTLVQLISKERNIGKMLTRFNKSFHSLNLEDKTSFDGEGNVTTRLRDS